MREAGAATLGLVATHGTGTPLGDPIESGALRKSAGGLVALPSSAEPLPLTLTAVKVLTGHLEGTAGLAGLLQAAACIEQLCAAPLRMRSMNPYVANSLAAPPGAPQARAPLSAHGIFPRAIEFAGTSSFGMSGVNAHAILAPPSSRDGSGPEVQGAGGSQVAAGRRAAWVWAKRDMRRPIIPVGHPLLLLASPAAGRGKGQGRLVSVEFSVPLGSPALAWLRDHVVGGRPVVPGAAYLEMALAAAHAAMLPGIGTAVVGLANVQFASPCMLPHDAAAPTPTLVAELDTDTGSLSVSSVTPLAEQQQQPGGHLRQQLHLSAQVVAVSTAAAAADAVAPSMASAANQGPPGPDACRARTPEPLDTTRLYSDLSAAGLQYGPDFRLIRRVHRTAPASGDVQQACAAASGCIQLPRAHLGFTAATNLGYLVGHPAALDCLLQMGAAVPEQGAGHGQAKVPHVPASIALFTAALPDEALHVPPLQPSATAAASPEPLRCFSTPGAVDGSGKQGSSSTLRDHVLLDGHGRVLCMVHTLEAKPMHSSGAPPAFGSGQRQLQQAKGNEPEMMYQVEWVVSEAVQEEGREQHGLGGIAQLQLDAAGGQLGREQDLAVTTVAALSAMGGLAAAAERSSAPLTLKLRAEAVGPSAIGPAGPGSVAGALAGMARALNAERTADGCSVDTGDALAPSTWPSAGGGLAIQCAAGAAQGQVALADGYGHRTTAGRVLEPRLLISPTEQPPAPYHFVPAPRGALTNLMPQPVDLPAAVDLHAPCAEGLAPDTVLVAVKAVGINFRDVLNVREHALPQHLSPPA